MLECLNSCVECAGSYGTVGLVAAAGYVGLNILVAMRKMRPGTLSRIVDGAVWLTRKDAEGTIKLPIVGSKPKK